MSINRPANRHVFCWILAAWMTVAQGANADQPNSTDQESPSKSWRFGVAKVNITPEAPMLMSGYASRETPATGKLTDLWAKALALEDASGERCVLITLDLVGIGVQTTRLIAEELQAKHNLGQGSFSICCSHTHTGPALAHNLRPMHYYWGTPQQRSAIESYTDHLRNQILLAVRDALADMQPGNLSWGNGNVTFATNRRENDASSVPRLRVEKSLRGPYDHDVPVLAVRNEADELRSVVFGYACHATVLSSFQWSGDYPGFAQIELEENHPGCVALFWAGCGADQNPLPRRTVDLARHYGRRLAAGVEEVLLTHEMTPVAANLSTSFRQIPLKYAALPTAEQLKVDEQSENKYEAARAALLSQQLQSDGKLAESYSYPLSVWRLGDVEWIFMGGEVVVDYALRLKHESQGSKTWVAAYANDVMAYIPSERVLREGRYEGATAMVYYGLPSAWAPGLEDQIHETIDQLRKTTQSAPDQATTEASKTESR